MLRPLLAPLLLLSIVLLVLIIDFLVPLKHSMPVFAAVQVTAPRLDVVDQSAFSLLLIDFSHQPLVIFRLRFLVLQGLKHPCPLASTVLDVVAVALQTNLPAFRCFFPSLLGILHCTYLNRRHLQSQDIIRIGYLF